MRAVSATNKPLPDTLYHYTDIHALQGIWENGELWGTESFYLNDTSELIAGLDAVRLAVVRKQADINKPEEGRLVETGKSFQQLLDLGSLGATETLVAELRNSASYVVSLSERADQLSQWRAYARAGYCIGFSTAALMASLTDSQNMARVNYLDGENVELFARRVIDMVSADRSRLAPENPYEEAVRDYRLSSRLIREAAFFKDASFAEEEEVRIVDSALFPDFHTPGKYGMTPRIKVPLCAGAITSIRVGPSPYTDQQARSVGQYVARVPFKKEESDSPPPQVLTSTVPYRDW
jgi:hypothetical protein